jgi:hypothetical protein
MRLLVDALQLSDAHLGVNLRRLNTGMAEHLLDEADIRAAFEHVSRAGVAEQVGQLKGVQRGN